MGGKSESFSAIYLLTKRRDRKSPTSEDELGPPMFKSTIAVPSFSLTGVGVAVVSEAKPAFCWRENFCVKGRTRL